VDSKIKVGKDLVIYSLNRVKWLNILSAGDVLEVRMVDSGVFCGLAARVL
jgi:hypothetical protein